MRAMVVLTCWLMSATAPSPPDIPPATSGAVVDAQDVAINGQRIARAPRPRTFRIAILPDRTTGRAWGMPYLHRAVADLQRIRPDAVFTIGDMVQGYTRRLDRWDAEVDEYLDAVRGLPADFFATAGNHEVIPGSRSSRDTQFEDRYRARFGPLWYSVDLTYATVLVLYSDDGLTDGRYRIGDEQLAWLATALDAAAARSLPIMLLMHRPLWRYEHSAWTERVRPLLIAAGVDLVIAGHFHALQRDRDDGDIAFHIVGTCGGMIDQHPLAGQLQHLSFVDFVEGAPPRVWHQPVGATLPDDFVRRVDQDRVFRLTGGGTGAGVISFRDSLPEPFPSAGAAVLNADLRNPLDVPITVSAELIRGPSESPVNGEMFITRTLIDAHNSFVIDAATPFELGDLAPITLSPGASASVPLSFRWQASDGPPSPPELRFTASFVDSHGRSVPVWLRHTPPIARILPIATPGPTGEVHLTRFPVLPWHRSPYDTLEPHPGVGVALESDGRLLIEIDLPDDDRPVDEVLTALPGASRWLNPFHDAILLTLGAPAEQTSDQFDRAAAGRNPENDPDRTGADRTERTLFLEPFRSGEPRGASRTLPPVAFELIAGGAGRGDARLEPVPDTVEIEVIADPANPHVPALVRIRLPARWGPFPGRSIGVSVADNDHTFHTQWRRLSPPGVDARLGKVMNASESLPP